MALALQNFNLPWLMGILGLIFGPWTILMYTIVFPLKGFDWVWIGLAVGADIVTYTGGYERGETNDHQPVQRPSHRAGPCPQAARRSGLRRLWLEV
jgi:hypothetical protein